MAKSLKQLQADEKRKKAKINKMESELSREKQALSRIVKEIPAARKKESDGKKKPVKKK